MALKLPPRKLSRAWRIITAVLFIAALYLDAVGFETRNLLFLMVGAYFTAATFVPLMTGEEDP